MAYRPRSKSISGREVGRNAVPSVKAAFFGANRTVALRMAQEHRLSGIEGCFIWVDA